MYVKSGSTVSLKCVITQSLEEPAYIFWYHDNERVLDYDRRYKDIRVERVGSDTTVGSLILHQATKEDSGNYTCSPSNLDSSSILLHVLNGKLWRQKRVVILVPLQQPCANNPVLPLLLYPTILNNSHHTTFYTYFVAQFLLHPWLLYSVFLSCTLLCCILQISADFPFLNRNPCPSYSWQVFLIFLPVSGILWHSPALFLLTIYPFSSSVGMNLLSFTFSTHVILFFFISFHMEKFYLLEFLCFFLPFLGNFVFSSNLNHKILSLSPFLLFIFIFIDAVDAAACCVSAFFLSRMRTMVSPLLLPRIVFFSNSKSPILVRNASETWKSLFLVLCRSYNSKIGSSFFLLGLQ